jgi:hypothetical protein
MAFWRFLLNARLLRAGTNGPEDGCLYLRLINPRWQGGARRRDRSSIGPTRGSPLLARGCQRERLQQVGRYLKSNQLRAAFDGELPG